MLLSKKLVYISVPISNDGQEEELSYLAGRLAAHCGKIPFCPVFNLQGVFTDSEAYFEARKELIYRADEIFVVMGAESELQMKEFAFALSLRKNYIRIDAEILRHFVNIILEEAPRCDKV